jgi:hypothetical protein
VRWQFSGSRVDSYVGVSISCRVVVGVYVVVAVTVRVKSSGWNGVAVANCCEYIKVFSDLGKVGCACGWQDVCINVAIEKAIMSFLNLLPIARGDIT